MAGDVRERRSNGEVGRQVRRAKTTRRQRHVARRGHRLARQSGARDRDLNILGEIEGQPKDRLCVAGDLQPSGAPLGGDAAHHTFEQPHGDRLALALEIQGDRAALEGRDRHQRRIGQRIQSGGAGSLPENGARCAGWPLVPVRPDLLEPPKPALLRDRPSGIEQVRTWSVVPDDANGLVAGPADFERGKPAHAGQAGGVVGRQAQLELDQAAISVKRPARASRGGRGTGAVAHRRLQAATTGLGR